MATLSLNLLLAASSKQAIEQAVQIVFLTRHQPVHLKEDSGTETVLDRIRAVLGFGEDVTDVDLYALRQDLVECIETPLQTGKLGDLAEYFAIFEGDVNPKLRQLLEQIIEANFASWLEACQQDRISLPRLKDFDWSFNFQRASSEVPEMSVPSLLMSLTVEQTPTSTTDMPDTEELHIELSREALETLIDGMGKIRDQLVAMN